MIDRVARAAGHSDDAVREPTGDLTALLARLERRFEGLEALLQDLRDALAERRRVKESYTTAEAAELLGKRPYTVREWCRYGRVNATKAMCGRGGEEEWRISHEELERIRNEGLLPLRREFPR